MFVEFTAKGLDVVQKSFEGIQGQIASTVSAAATLGTVAAGSVLAFGKAGLAASTHGAALSAAVEQLSMQLGSLFIPIIEKAIDLVQSATTWFAGLGEGAQQMIGGLVLATVAVKGLSMAFGTLGIASGGLLPIIGLVVTGLAAFMSNTDAGQKSLGGLADAFKPLMNAAGGLMEALGPLLEMLGSSLVSTLQPVIEIVSSLVEVLAPVIGLFVAIIQPIAAVAGVILKLVGTVVSLIAKLTLAPFAALADFLGKVLAPVLKGIMQFIEFLSKAIDKFANSVKAMADKVKGFFGIKPKTAADEDKDGKKKGHMSLTKSAGAFESLQATYARIQSAASKTDYPKRQTELLEHIAGHTNRTANNTVYRPPPAVNP